MKNLIEVILRLASPPLLPHLQPTRAHKHGEKVTAPQLFILFIYFVFAATDLFISVCLFCKECNFFVLFHLHLSSSPCAHPCLVWQFEFERLTPVLKSASILTEARRRNTTSPPASAGRTRARAPRSALLATSRRMTK